jgi:hypothetical protein
MIRNVSICFLTLCALVGCSSNDSVSEQVVGTTLTCTEATSEDLNYLTEGLADTSLSLTKAFKSYFNKEDREEIKQIFPTFTNPYVVAAEINGVAEGSTIGLWSIQRFDYGARIFALNENAKLYSIHGVDIDDNDLSGRLRTKILELSINTSALECTNN